MRSGSPWLTLFATVALVAACQGTTEDTTSTTEDATAPTTDTTTTTVSPPAVRSANVIDSGGGDVDYLGHFAQVIVPPDDLPFVLYLGHDGGPEDDRSWEFRAAKCEDPGCSRFEVAATFPLRAQAWQPPVMILDPDGLPAFIYIDMAGEEDDRARFEEGLAPDLRLHLVRCVDSACRDHTDTDLGPGSTPSLLISTDGLPVVAHDSLADNVATLLTCGDAACTTRAESTHPQLRYAFGTPLLWGPEGMPVIGFAGGLQEDPDSIPTTSMLAAVFCDDPACSNTRTATITTFDERPEMIDVAAGPDGPVFAFSLNNQTHVLRCLDQECAATGTVSLVEHPQHRDNIQMAIGTDGLPVFAYGAEGRLVVTKCSDPDCTEGTASDVERSWVFSLDLALDDTDNPVLALYSPPELWVIRCADPACTVGAETTGTWDQESSSYEAELSVGSPMDGWHQATTAEGRFGPGGGGGLSRVVEGGPGLLAVGTACGMEAGNTAGCYVAVWGSADGRHWAQVADLGPGEVSAVATIGSTTVVGGSSCGFEEQYRGGSCAPILWTSPDGVEWSVASTDEQAFVPCSGEAPESCSGSVEGLVGLGSGGLWAFGWSGLGSTSWTSADGIDWELSQTPFLPFGEDLKGDWWIEQAFPGGDGIVVAGDLGTETAVPMVGIGIDESFEGPGVRVERVGEDSGAAAAGLEEGDVIVSVEGVTISDSWSFSEAKSGRHVGDTLTMVVLRDGSEIELAVTLGGYEEWFYSVLMATSADGSAWRQLDAPIVAEGDVWLGWVTEWAGGLSSLVEACDLSYNCEQFLLTSDDGLSWDQIPLAGVFGEATIFGLYPFGEELLGVGAVFDENTGESAGALAVSPDGITWTVYGVDPDVFPRGDAGFNDVIAFGDIIVAVGAGGQGPAVWWYER